MRIVLGAFSKSNKDICFDGKDKFKKRHLLSLVLYVVVEKDFEIPMCVLQGKSLDYSFLRKVYNQWATYWQNNLKCVYVHNSSYDVFKVYLYSSHVNSYF